MLVGKGSRSRSRDKAALSRALWNKLINEMALRSHVASADEAAG